jgi:hypothetical protein
MQRFIIVAIKPAFWISTIKVLILATRGSMPASGVSLILSLALIIDTL